MTEVFRSLEVPRHSQGVGEVGSWEPGPYAYAKGLCLMLRSAMLGCSGEHLAKALQVHFSLR